MFSRLVAFVVMFTVFGFMAEVSGSLISILFEYLYYDPDQKVTGEIVESRKYYFKTNVGGIEAYEVEYVYFIDGTPFRNSKVARAYKTENVDEVLGKYPIGTKVEVYYDGRNPSKSILQNGPPSLKLIVGFIAIFLVSVLSGLVQVPIKLKNRFTKSKK